MPQPWIESGARRFPAAAHGESSSAVRAAAGERAPALQVLLVAMAALAPYLNALNADFTFDDVGLIRDNPAVQVLPARNLLSYVHHPGDLFRPLTMLTYAANATWSSAPFGFHLVNVVLHALVAVAVLLLARRLVAPVAALAAALLFAVHPIHTEAVTGVVGRAELIAALGVLVTLLAGARALCDTGLRRVLWWAVSVTAFAAAMLAKESAVAALGLIAALHWWIERSAGVRRRALLVLPYGLAALAYLVLRVAVVGTLTLPERADWLDNPLAHVDAASRVRTATIVLLDYFSQLTVPLQLSADYSFNQIPVALTWSDPRFLLAAAFMAAVAVAIIVAIRRAPELAIAAAFALLPLALTANVLFPIGTIKAERLLYLPSVGWCLAVGWLVARASVRHAGAASVSLALLVLAFGARAWVRNDDWRDEGTLYAVTLRDAPASAKAHHNYAVALERAGQFDAAMSEFRQSLEIDPAFAAAAFGIGHVYGVKGIQAGAVHWYEAALRDDPEMGKAHLRLGLIRQERGELDTAEAAFLSGLHSEPNNLLLIVSLSALHLAQGDRWRTQATLARLDDIGTIDPDEQAVVAAARHEIEAALR